jgi:hypothetical protein
MKTRPTLYEEAQRLNLVQGNHESDLHLLDVQEARELVRQFPRHAKQTRFFVSAIDRQPWLDVPFAFDPFWTQKALRNPNQPTTTNR